LIDLNEFYTENTHINKKLLQFPIRFAPASKSRFYVYFADNQPELAEAWIDYLRDELSIPPEEIRILKSGFNFNTKYKLKARMKFFVVIMNEYMRIWSEFNIWIKKKLKSNNVIWHKGMDKNHSKRIRWSDKKSQWQFFAAHNKWHPVLLSFTHRKSNSGRGVNYLVTRLRSINITPSENIMFKSFVDIVNSSFMQYIMKKRLENSILISEFIVENWFLL